MKFPEGKNLYLVLTAKYRPDKTICEIAENAISGGVNIMQMREKKMPHKKVIETGKALSKACKKNNIPFIVNDNPYLAKKTDADGVHLGQNDIKKFPTEKVRKILGKNKIIGVSTHSVSQFKKANEMDTDYIAFGPIFPTQTKNYHIGIGNVETVLKIAAKPVVFIGGINLENIDILLDKGAENIAVISAIMQAEDIKKTTQRLKQKLTGKK